MRWGNEMFENQYIFIRCIGWQEKIRLVNFPVCGVSVCSCHISILGYNGVYAALIIDSADRFWSSEEENGVGEIHFAVQKSYSSRRVVLLR